MSDVFVDGKLVGTVEDGSTFVREIIRLRRLGKVNNLINVNYVKKEDKVKVLIGRNRVRRPLIVVENGKPLLDKDRVEKLKSGEIKWSDLVKEGVIEELDALEEEGTLVALNQEDLTKDHTHLEVNPISIFGINSSLVPYANFNQSSRLSRGQKTQKQGASMYALNFLNRLDTSTNLLHYPQKPVVRTQTQDLFGDLLVGGQNVVIAIMNYEGYNMEDAIVLNRASIDRGFGRLTHYRPYDTEKMRYAGGQIDSIGIPDKDIQGYTIEEDYRFLDEDGIVSPESMVKGPEVIIGKTSPPRFLSKLESFSATANTRKDSSVRVKFNEKGHISEVLLTESKDGNPLIRIEVRDTRLPEIGDKFATRHGQKGVVGMIADPQDIPFTASGIQPDIIFSPFGMRRLTVDQILEALAGKVASLRGEYVYGTAFNSENEKSLRKSLINNGFREDGTETLYDGRTGKEYKARVFVGNMFYLRLKYQVIDKLQARARGRVALLTRQPTAGKAVEGGLRFGEMEKETLVAHGASLLMKERFDSDKTHVYVCDRCGDVAMYDYYDNKPVCLSCGDKAKTSKIEVSYAFKLFLDELKSMGIRPKLNLKNKFGGDSSE